MKSLSRFVTFLCAFVLGSSALFGARIADLTEVKGRRPNQLTGYGIVTGLAGQGDSRIEYTELGILNALERLGVRADKADVSRNIAAVTVTANFEPDAKAGTRMNVTVASIGNADSLQGGVLLQTPLFGADGTVYAVAQGPVSVGGLSAGNAGGANVQLNHPTTGIVNKGAIVEREVEQNMVKPDQSLDLLLRHPDAVTATKMAQALNKYYPGSSQAADPATVNVRIPAAFRGQETNFLAAISQVDVRPNVPAKVIVNERTGTIVATEAVRISPVAVSNSNITIFIDPVQRVSQPRPFSAGATQVLEGDDATLIEEQGRFEPVDSLDPAGATSVQDLSRALNLLGLTTREMTSILQLMQDAGALQAELVIN